MMCTKQGMYNALVVGEMFHSASLPVNASQYNFCFVTVAFGIIPICTDCNICKS